jgi:hypothetical protein
MRQPPVWLLTLSLLAAATPVPAQQLDRALAVFLDCQTDNCDFDHFRREVDFVNWVREPQLADVHVLVTSEGTGGGGREYSVALFGRRSFAQWSDTLRHTSRNTDSDAEVREALTGRLQLGLARYVARTPPSQYLRLLYEPAEEAGIAPATPADDPWNFWTFRIGLQGSLAGESQESGIEIDGSLSASRVTESFKIDFGVSGEYERETFEELDEGETLISTSQDYFADVLAVWSLGPHWSTGFGVDAGRSTFSNEDLTLSGGPAIEFNFFPYSESTNRQITLRYQTEGAWFDYREINQDSVTRQTLARHRLSIDAAFREPWGQLNGSIEGTQYLHDPTAHRIEMFGRVEFRVFRGLSVDFDGEFARIKDQFSLPAAGLTPEEILLRRRERETDFRYELSAGFTIRFGSAFANVVNPRMR